MRLQVALTRRARRVERALFAARDARLRALRQAISAARAVKFFAWEAQYAEAIDRLRDVEVRHMKHNRACMVGSVSLGKAFPVIATCATLLATALMAGGGKRAVATEDAFATLALFQQLRVGMVFTPLAIILLNTYAGSFERAQRYLMREERARVDVPPATSACAVELSDVRAARAAPPRADEAADAGADAPAAEEVKEEARGAFELRVDSLVVRRGELVAVVGAVGSGKTTLVDALLGGVALAPAAAGGGARVERDAGLAPQVAFVVSGTIRENVLMGRPLDADAFAAACELAGLARDVAGFSRGAETVVGEFGTTLSGGQAHRLNIARAFYGRPRLALLDGSLAAVDPAIARHIFEEVKAYVRAEPATRSALLVVSQLHLLPECDRVVYLEHGRIARQGAFDDLLAHDDFAAFCRTYSKASSATADDAGAAEEDAADATADAEAAAADDAAGAAAAAAAAAATSDEAAALVKKERVTRGVVSWRVMRAWVSSMTYTRFALVLMGYGLSMAVLAANDLWMGRWAAAEGRDAALYMGVYAALSTAYLLVIVGVGIYLTFASARASLHLHGKCLRTVLAAPVGWFESVPSGRVLSRFGADIENMDMQWSTNVDVLLTMSAMVVQLLVVMTVVVPVLAPVNFLCLVALARLVAAINRVNRDVKRIANNAVSPAVTTITEAERGRAVALSLGCSEFFVARQEAHVDAMLSAFFMSNAVGNAAWLSGTAFSCCTSLAVALLVLFSDQAVSRRNAPVAVAYALVIPFFTGMMCNSTLEVSTLATSLERLFEYLPAAEGGVLPSEAPRVCEGDAKICLLYTSPSPRD